MADPQSAGARAALEWGTLDRSGIVEAVMRLAHRGGVDAITIRAVAEELGASRMALYRHVRDKQELLDLVADEISWRSADLDLPDALPWADRLATLAERLRTQFAEHPAFIDLMVERSAHGRGGIRMAEHITRAVAASGLGDDAVARYALIFADVVLGRIQREHGGDPTRPSRNARLLDAAAHVTDGSADAVRRYADAIRHVDADAVFSTEVAMVIAAIRAELDAS